ncbi:hypothetical protein [Halobaculum gomorrense]|uniref:DUF5658 domain-containing protein n=1 Tax=Halobaculum gomorrense TaxID=43928 RepID=A0A1M5UFS7_9EURY|nr:hypothetical protein [Halobaculum gomorrense]SHH61758.1 hypothetical protein SAMN05443636_3019 [Halobaculum gomorrense]
MTADAGGDATGRFSLAETPFESGEFSRLWFLATVTYGVGDIVTTLALINYSERVSEANVLVATAVDWFGEFGLVGVKLAVFGACLAISLSSARAGDRFGYYIPPVVLSVLGAFTTALNLRLLIG